MGHKGDTPSGVREKIGIVIYANPDHYPPIISIVQLLSRAYDIIILCRNQGEEEYAYPNNVTLYRLGKLKTPREKEAQNPLIRFLEFLFFNVCTIFLLSFHCCRLVYSFDSYGLVPGFIASRLPRRKPLLYHHLDFWGVRYGVCLGGFITHLEKSLSRYAEIIVFPDINRAKLFQKMTGIARMPEIVMNTPLLQTQLPTNTLEEFLKSKGLSAKTKIILYQGSISEGNSLSETLRSMRYWPEDAVFVLGGRIYEQFMVKFKNEIEKLQLSDRIFLLPLVSHEKIFSYTVGASVGLALYNYPDINRVFVVGASNKIFIYLSMGVPVIVNDTPNFRSVLDSSVAYFVDPNSPAAIAGAINSAFYDQETYRRKSQAARLKHLETFNYEHQFLPVLEYIKNTVKPAK